MKMNEHWIEIGPLSDIPRQGARVVKTDAGNIAVFRTVDDEVFALRDKCPHKGGPLHDWKINLDSGVAVAPDEGCAARYPVKVKDGQVSLSLLPDTGCPNH